MHRRDVIFVLAVLAITLGPPSLTLAQRRDVPPARVSSRDRGASSVPDASRARLAESYGKLPLSFAANEGATDARVRFLSRGPGYTLFLTDSEAVLSLGG